MSYCRWSSMDYQCDLYVYEDVRGGVTVHVAAKRRRPDQPSDTEDLHPIGLSRDGETFNGPREEILEIVKSLIEEGYQAPDTLLDDIKEGWQA